MIIQIRKIKCGAYRITDIPAGRMGPKLVNLYISETTDKYILDRENLKKLYTE